MSKALPPPDAHGIWMQTEMIPRRRRRAKQPSRLTWINNMRATEIFGMRAKVFAWLFGITLVMANANAAVASLFAFVITMAVLGMAEKLGDRR